MRKSGLSVALFGLLAVFSLPMTSAQAQATRTWVSGVGDDANPCSRTAPCKTFAGAISKTAAGGEIDCLDPGGFGAVTITKGMTLDCGTQAGGILNAGGVNGIIVNTSGAGDKVVLRNLVINGGLTPVGPGLNGVRWLNLGLELHLDRVVIQGDTTNAVDVSKTSPGLLYVRNSYFTETGGGIIMTSTAAAVTASIDGSHFKGISGNCVSAGTNSNANVSNSVFTFCGSNAIIANASGATVSANNNVMASNGTALAAVSGANLRTSNNELYDNTTGISAASGNWTSANNNRISGTGTASLGTPTAIFVK
jgi:hypothetical protein